MPESQPNTTRMTALRFHHVQTMASGATMYEAPHELDNAVRLIFPAGYFTGMSTPEYVDVGLDVTAHQRDQQQATGPRLSPETRTLLQERVAELERHGLFGDGLEADYLLYGVAFLGAKDLTDQELVEKYHDLVADDLDPDLTDLLAPFTRT